MDGILGTGGPATWLKSGHIGPPDVWAWKQVDLSHAPSIERGSLRLGRLADYAGLENGRADSRDGAVVVNVGIQEGFKPEGRAAIDRLSRFGFTVGDGPDGHAAVVMGGTITRQVQRVYAFCMTEVGCAYDPDPEKNAKALFEVNVRALADTLMETMSDRFAGYAYGRVAYDRVEYSLNENFPDAHPFIKDAQHFSEEREIRLVFGLRPGAPYDGPIITEENPKVGALFRRIAGVGDLSEA